MLSASQHISSLKRVIAKGVGEQRLHMINLCEVGSHKQGLSRSMVCAQELISSACLSSHYKAMSCQAYMATWQAADEPTDDTSVTLTLVGELEVVELPSSGQPQLVIMVFTIVAAEHRDMHGLLISGQLHIRTQWLFSDYCASPCAHRRRALGPARTQPHRAAAGGRAQPVEDRGLVDVVDGARGRAEATGAPRGPGPTADKRYLSAAEGSRARLRRIWGCPSPCVC